MIIALLVSSGAAWEPQAVAALQAHPGTVLLKRCVDVPDLLAAASTGQADVAILGLDLAGLDQTVIADLTRHEVRTVAIVQDPEATMPRTGRIGITTTLAAARIEEIADVVTTLPASPTLTGADRTLGSTAVVGEDALPPYPHPVPMAPAPVSASGRIIAVWGAAGAPGRTTVATGLAAELARRGLGTTLLDADPYGGAVGQHLGILDEVSGLLAAARLVAAGTLEERFSTVQRRLSDRLHVITGLPRPDRWSEVRAGALTEISEHARCGGQVVVDTGFSLEPDLASDLGRPGRNDLTREVLEVADDIVLVGGADPVGLSRLARACVDLHEFRPDPPVQVVVNRMRPTLGWRETDLIAMLAGFGSHRGVHFLPDDQAAVDKALVAGQLLIESGESALTRALAAVLDAMAHVAADARR
ncbi:MAG: hypothetical protein L0H31_06475 [Nocardioidaceae bacterium]|nr:hypothetical protein [Nocardioidaceae bacterium]